MSERRRHTFKLGEFIRYTRRRCWRGYIVAYADDTAPGCVKVHVTHDRCNNPQRKPFYRIIHQDHLALTNEQRLSGFPD